MGQKWIVEIQVRNFFKKKFDLRARTKIGKFGDTIRRANFESTMLEEFTDSEIRNALEYGIIVKDKIRIRGTVRNILVWMEEECKFQPIWWKRWIKKSLDKLNSWRENEVQRGRAR